MAHSIGRSIVLVLLALAMAGFGICTLCGGVMGLSALTESSGGRGYAGTVFVFTAIGGVITWCLWLVFRKLRQPPSE